MFHVYREIEYVVQRVNRVADATGGVFKNVNLEPHA